MPTFYIIRHAHKEQGNFYNPRLRRQPDDLAEAPLPNRINRMEFPHINLDEILKGRATHNLTATGRIVDEQGNGIYQASVMLAGDTGQRGVTTEQDGSFIFPTIAAGQNRVHVEKYGFIPGDSSLTVPQTAHETIRISQAASCQVLVHLQQDNGQPFVGVVKVLIQTPDGQRLESMDQRSEAIFSLPPGDFTISVTSPEAEWISLASAPVRVLADCSERPTLTFTISPPPRFCNIPRFNFWVSYAKKSRVVRIQSINRNIRNFIYI